MNNASQDRPAALKRTPKPAADENVDPVDAQPVVAAKPRSTAAPAAPRERVVKKREVTFPLSTRVVQEVLDTIDIAVSAGLAPSQRAAIEEAIIGYWKDKLPTT